MSLAIQKLDDELGVRLFERTSRRMSITRGGEDALRDARAVLAAADTMTRRAREAAQGLVGSLSIGFISLPPHSFPPHTLRTFTEDCARVRLVLQEGVTDRIIGDVQSGGLDIGLVFRTPDLPPATLDTRPSTRGRCMQRRWSSRWRSSPRSDSSASSGSTAR